MTPDKIAMICFIGWMIFIMTRPTLKSFDRWMIVTAVLFIGCGVLSNKYPDSYFYTIMHSGPWKPPIA